jgi:hypothetical protein
MVRSFITAVLLSLAAFAPASRAQVAESSQGYLEADTMGSPIATRLPPVDDEYRNTELPPGDELDSPALEQPNVEHQAPQRGNSTSGGMGGPFGRGGPPIGLSAMFNPAVSLEGQPGNFSQWGEELRLTAPAWTTNPHLLLVTSSVASDQFKTPAVFPTSGTEFPESLWNIRVGTFYMRPLENGWKFGAGLNVGSASDIPFGAIRHVNPALFSFLNVPRPGENSWNFSVYYLPLSEIPFPIPGVAYFWHASDALQMNIGLPAQITYQPNDTFAFTASYMLLTTVNVRGTWNIDDNWSAYASYESRNRSWYLHDRVKDDERMFAYEQGLFVGVQRPVWRKLKADVSAGYLFDRFYFIGENYDERHRDRIDIAAGASISAQLGLAY